MRPRLIRALGSVVFGNGFGFFEFFELFHRIAAFVAQGDAEFFGHLADSPDQLFAPLFG